MPSQCILVATLYCSCAADSISTARGSTAHKLPKITHLTKSQRSAVPVWLFHVTGSVSLLLPLIKETLWKETASQQHLAQNQRRMVHSFCFYVWIHLPVYIFFFFFAFLVSAPTVFMFKVFDQGTWHKRKLNVAQRQMSS